MCTVAALCSTGVRDHSCRDAFSEGCTRAVYTGPVPEPPVQDARRQRLRRGPYCEDGIGLASGAVFALSAVLLQTPNVQFRFMCHWLMKSEPDEASIDHLANAAHRTLPWTERVRSYQARNFMRDGMQIGDGVLFYHSSWSRSRASRELAEVASTAYPDPTQFDSKSPYYDPKSSRGKRRAGCSSTSCSRRRFR